MLQITFASVPSQNKESTANAKSESDSRDKQECQVDLDLKERIDKHMNI